MTAEQFVQVRAKGRRTMILLFLICTGARRCSLRGFLYLAPVEAGELWHGDFPCASAGDGIAAND